MAMEPFFILHRWGKSEKANDPVVLQSLIAELDADLSDDEHVSVSVRRPDGWCIGAYVSGLVLFENVEDLSMAPRHLRDRSRDSARLLMEQLVRGDLIGLEGQPWRSGNG